MAGQPPLLVYLFVYLTLSVAATNAVIIEEQWIAVKSLFLRIKNYITESPTTTTTTAVPRFIPRGTRPSLMKQPSRMHLNELNRGEGCELKYEEHFTQSLLADDERIYEPLTYEKGVCIHSCFQDKYTGKWTCCKDTAKENLELAYFRNGSTTLRIRIVEDHVITACAYIAA